MRKQMKDYEAKYRKPLMNADERRYFPASDFSNIIHRKVRKERKA